MNERFWRMRDNDYWHPDNPRSGERPYEGSRHDERVHERYEDEHRSRYGEPDPSFYYGGFRDKRHMGPIYSGENFGSSGYGHSRFWPEQGGYGNRERYYGQGGMNRYEDRNRPQGYYPDERFGESHQHHHHARTSDMWDRPAAYNTGGYGPAEFGRRQQEPDYDTYENRESQDSRGQGQRYEDIHRWRGW